MADDFAYIIAHCGARVVCAHSDYLDAVDGIRAELPGVEHFIALEGEQDGWPRYEDLLAESSSQFEQPAISRRRPNKHQLHQRHHLAPEGGDAHAPQRLPQRGRHADASAPDGRGPLPVDAADVPRQRLDVPLGR
jgi:hypothetical protein